MKSKAIKCLVAVSCCIAFFVSQSSAAPWEEFAVSASGNDQFYPDLDGGIVVWQEDFIDEGYGWDVCGSDISDPGVGSFFYVTDEAGDQIEPAISGELVVFLGIDGTDSLIRVADVNDVEAIYDFTVSQQSDVTVESLGIHGNTVIWQDDRWGDIDVFGADIHNTESIVDFDITPYEHDQRNPVIWRNKVVCETDFFEDWDIMSMDIWLRDNPREYPVLYDIANQQNPAISGDIVVWQGDDNGDMDIFAADISNPDLPEVFEIVNWAGEQTNPDVDGNIVVWQEEVESGGSYQWDIYGYNITTGQEFVICDNEYDQMNPVISGNTVVWEDDRDGVWQIYAVILDGFEIADCDVKPEGDLNGDCSVDIYDLARLSANWLRDELVY
ncbi:MAG: hypothetical protein FVQ82_17165 [Planctomycetes bacterium]|nr:hypothetical protein [Planctomycetota bacterium]